MSTDSGSNITALLKAWSAGDPGALDQLLPILHDELKRTARRRLARERKEHTLQPTALVNEAFLRLIDAQNVRYEDRTHFFAVSAQIMRRILVNHALARGAAKRGGGDCRISFDEALVAVPDRDAELVRLDDALNALAALDARKARIVELRFFAGLSVEETATILEVSPQTVLRDWNLSKSWLAREMSR